MTPEWKIRRVSKLRGHVGCAWAAAWRPDGGLLATCGSDRRICLWGPQYPHLSSHGRSQAAADASSARSDGLSCAVTEGKKKGEQRRAWALLGVVDTGAVHTRTLRSVAWSPDGFWLAAASFDATVSLWCSNVAGTYRDPCRFTQVQVIEGHEHEVKGVAWSRTGKYLATCSRDKTVWIHENSGGDMSPWCRWASRLGGQRESSRGSPRSAGGTDQVSKGERKAEKEDAELESFLEDLEWPPPSVPAGDGDEGVFYVAAVLSGHTQDVKAVKWHPCEDVCVSASYDDTFRVWGVRDGESDWGLLQVVRAHSSTIWHVAFSRLGSRLATCSDDRSLRIWTCLSPDVMSVSSDVSTAWPDNRSKLSSSAFVSSSEDGQSSSSTPSTSPASQEACRSITPGSVSGDNAAVTLSSRILPPWFVTGLFRGAPLSGEMDTADPRELPPRVGFSQALSGQPPVRESGQGKTTGPNDSGEAVGTGAAKGTSPSSETEGAILSDEQSAVQSGDKKSRGVLEATPCTDGSNEGPARSVARDNEDVLAISTECGQGKTETRTDSAERDQAERDRQRVDQWRPQAALLAGYHQRPVYFVDWHPTLNVIVTASGDNSLRFFGCSDEDDDEANWVLLFCRRNAHYSDINCAVWNPATPDFQTRSQALLGRPKNCKQKEALLASVDDDGRVAIWAVEVPS